MKIPYIVFAYLSLFALGFIDNSRGPIYPEILNFFNIDNTKGALIFSGSALSGFVVAVFARKWLPIHGALNSSKFALFVQSIACIGMGLVNSNESGFYLFLLFSLTFGISVGVLSITLNLIINESTQLRLKRRVFAGLHSMYGVASLIAPFVIGKLFSFDIHWQTYFLTLGILPLGFLILFIGLRPQKLNSINIACINLTIKQQLILGTVFAAYICGEILISTRLVIYLNKVKGFSLQDSSQFLSLFFCFLLMGRLIFTFFHFEIESKKLLKISLISSILTLIGGILFYSPLLLISGLAMSYFFPCAMDWLGECFGKNMEAIFSKIMAIVGGALVVLHWCFGGVASVFGLDKAIWIAPLLHILVLYILQCRTDFLAKKT
jgi:fucose permease